MTLDDFIFIKKLGFGQFGSVLLVKSTITRELYALKIINKKNASFHNLEMHIVQER
jgi:cGMP-dependent protein kinase